MSDPSYLYSVFWPVSCFTKISHEATFKPVTAAKRERTFLLAVLQRQMHRWTSSWTEKGWCSGGQDSRNSWSSIISWCVYCTRLTCENECVGTLHRGQGRATEQIRSLSNVFLSRRMRKWGKNKQTNKKRHSSSTTSGVVNQHFLCIIYIYFNKHSLRQLVFFLKINIFQLKQTLAPS